MPGNKEKSIAVLPFINDSSDPENVFFINGVMEAILDNLSKIRDLDVRSRTSVEQYRNKNMTIRQIAKELGVNYIVEGAGQKIGDQVCLSIQLIEAETEKHLFSHRYNKKLIDNFNLQGDVAIDVASHIKARITPFEKDLIERLPTTNLAAWEMNARGTELHNIAQLEDNSDFDQQASVFFKKAIELDTTFANPYTELGWIVMDNNPDSALLLANKALHYDAKNPDAYALKGFVYDNYIGREKEAEEAYHLALVYNPNFSSAYRFLGDLYFKQGNCSAAIENQLRAYRLETNSFQERNNLISLWSNLYSLGFYKESQKYAVKLVELTNDSSYLQLGLISMELDKGNYESALELAFKMYAKDTTHLNNIWELGYTHLYQKNFSESFRLLNKYSEIMKHKGLKIKPNYLFGWVYLENGYKKEADYHFEGSIKEMNKILEMNQPSESCVAYLNLTKIYSVRNERAKAFENLRKAKALMKTTVFRIKDFKNCTMLDNIRNEPEFAAFIREGENKYQAEHEKVKKLLQEEGIMEGQVK